MNEKALEIWKSSWDPSVHESERAAKRIKSAKSAKLTPIKIDTDDLYGYFQGSSGRYETWLDSCPCKDFSLSRLPCKHIYRLAIELGVIDEKTVADRTAILKPLEEKVSLSETLDIVEKLSEEAQCELLKIASRTTSKYPFVQINADNIADELIKSGIVADDGTGLNETINFGTKPEIIDFLTKHNIPHKKSDKKDILKQLCTTTADPNDAAKHFGVHRLYNVRIPVIYSRQQIHYYLHRKYDFERIWNGDSYDLNGVSVPLLETDLPDDKVTNELIKRGYYKRPTT